MKREYDLTVLDLLASGDEEAIAISAPGRHGQSYTKLHEQARLAVSFFNGLGIGRNDRVALVLPNGPEMAAAFAAITCGAAVVPLNPTFREAEFNRYFSDMGVSALVVERGSGSPSLAVATERSLPIIELHVPPGAFAGQFHLIDSGNTTSKAVGADRGFARPTDVALVLPTSGTVSRPKIVPLRR